MICLSTVHSSSAMLYKVRDLDNSYQLNTGVSRLNTDHRVCVCVCLSGCFENIQIYTNTNQVKFSLCVLVCVHGMCTYMTL